MKRALVLAVIGSSLALAAPRANAANPSTARLAPYARLAASQDGRHLLAFARESMLAYWGDGDVPAADGLPDWPAAPCGVYITLVSGAQTRACVGSAAPMRGTLSETIRVLAREALRADRRRPPVTRDELDTLRIVIAFADDGQPLSNPALVDPGREGLLVTSPRGEVAFLPGEARTVRWALGEARRIGVLSRDAADASFRRFHVVTLAEPAALPTDEEGSDAYP